MASPDGHSNAPIRLFRADVLESFSHMRPVTVLVLWSPAALPRRRMGLPPEAQGRVAETMVLKASGRGETT